MWGDGTAIRCYIYVDDLVDGIIQLTRSTSTSPSTSDPGVRDREGLGRHRSGCRRQDHPHRVGRQPVGVRSRTLATIIDSLGWSPKHPLRDRIAATYPWINSRWSQLTISADASNVSDSDATTKASDRRCSFAPEQTGVGPPTGIAEHIARSGSEVSVITRCLRCPSWRVNNSYRRSFRLTGNRSNMTDKQSRHSLPAITPSSTTRFMRPLFGPDGLLHRDLAEVRLRLVAVVRTPEQV